MTIAQPNPAGDMKFSVIIATMNRRDLVLEAVRSILQQTYPAHEVIVVVDGSDDNTAQAIRERYPEVEVLEQENRGESAARNLGISVATGNWLGFLDDDDLWHPDKLQRAVEHLQQQPDCTAIQNPHFYFADSDDGPRFRLGIGRHFVARDFDECVRRANELGLLDEAEASRLRVTGDSYRLMLERNRGTFSSTLVRRDVLLRAGLFPAHASYGEDWIMFVNVARFAEWHVLPWRLGFTRLHAVQQTGDAALGGMKALAGLVSMWYLGRPMPDRVRDAEFGEQLERYGPVYRRVVHGFVWQALRRGRLLRSLRLYGLGACLLPRWQDRAYVWLPKPIAWRIDRRTRALPKGVADETGRWPALYRSPTPWAP